VSRPVERRLTAAADAQPARTSDAIVPFKIQVPDSTLRDLKARLEHDRFADEFPDAGWDYGTNLQYIQSLMNYWRDR
jgi:microsomal epoxide hydrolase